MYKVVYTENGEKKESQAFAERNEAFGFQAGLLTRRVRRPDGSWDIELDGVYAVEPSFGA